jgi:hypothetical protein
MTDPIGNDTAAGVWVIIIVSAVFTGVILLIAYLLTAITLSLFFRKVGVDRWIAWVPFYNTWRWLEVGGQPGPIALLSLIPYGGIVTAVFLAIGMHRTGIAFRKDSAWVVLGIFLPWLWCILLSRPEEHYDPGLLAAYGYPPPRAGSGAAVAPAPPAPV